MLLAIRTRLVVVALAGALALFIAFPPWNRSAVADWKTTDSWGCIWVGETWFSGSTGYGRTAGDPDCTSGVILRFQWYSGGWNDTGNVYQSSSTYSYGALASSVIGSHQLDEQNYGLGQWLYTSE